MVQSVVYLIEGPRSLSDAIVEFNKKDHSKCIFERKCGLGAYVKRILGRDFAINALSKRHGIAVEEQIMEDKGTRYDIHIKIGNGGIGRHFNAVLIINRDISQNLFNPIYMVDCGNIEITEANWINISIPKSKLRGKVNE